ncbi:hypothetical protein DFH28DRAFT_1194209 [Melampsora americana]|nr:hypothetical protein DFH28DRAFT_1194209 [Melampsora americana]
MELITKLQQEVTRKLAEFERSYQDAGGSLHVSMLLIRKSFAEVIPFNSRNWYCHWSNFAIRSLKLDRDAHIPLFKNQLPVPVLCPRSESDPVYIFAPSKNTIYPPDLSRAPTPVPISTLDTSSELRRDIPCILSTNAKKRKHHKQKDTPSDSNSDSSTKSEKNRRKFAFISKKKEPLTSTSSFTPGALSFYEDVKAYNKSISQAVRDFNNTSKLADFLDVLTKDLLLGKFINLRRIKGELLNPKKGDTSYMSVGKEKGLEVSKFLHLEILNLAEWLCYFGIFKKAIKAAFPDCEDSIKQYGKYIKSQLWSVGIMANWKNIAGYDAAFRNSGC